MPFKSYILYAQVDDGSCTGCPYYDNIYNECMCLDEHLPHVEIKKPDGSTLHTIGRHSQCPLVLDPENRDSSGKYWRDKKNRYKQDIESIVAEETRERIRSEICSKKN